MKIWRVAAASLFLGAVPAHAVSTAEFLQMERYFAMGFVLGVLRHEVDVLGDADDPYQGQRIGQCLERSKIQLKTIYELAIAEGKAHPEEMAYPAVGAIIRTVRRMCPP